ncbi:SPOR domain-containing protein [Photobacterium sp. DNB23_23_1]|uniref:SPOR domain-containing protein n=1 Tax=Photobacterium pectinilyticum TaxID=2906793 RepID=A0ABT1MYQ2_9GAMM|nr:SPOR domain-containing protein [Photobacterium sp. ZSDE20]MCQ1056774.1 SPOR domain-containing protein [Photobacterium sp. ZSDE20]MDD1820839.1 SPOR domain-containing protein [Photobacterium sp. ZSDE20]
MATKDYVKRGRAAAKKPRGNRNQVSSSGFPIKWAAIALCLVGALGYGLYYLSANPAPQPQQPTSPSVTKPEPVKPVRPKAEPVTPPKASKPLPPKPEEKWRYIEELENKEVQVDAKKEQAPTKPYLMQCGAYRSQSQAEERKAMIAFQGLTSQIKVSQGEKGNWYRVVLGPYPQKRKAESDRNQLRRAGIEPCAIWFWE